VMYVSTVNHLVANAGIWSSCFFEEITNITAFHNVIVRDLLDKTTLTLVGNFFMRKLQIINIYIYISLYTKVWIFPRLEKLMTTLCILFLF
jgi:hypothetical protein